VTFLRVQYVSHISTSVRSSDDLGLVLAVTTCAVLAIAALLFIRDWRRTMGRASSTLVRETERWLRDQST